MTSLRRWYIDDLGLENFSPNTTKVYVHAVEKSARHFGRSPEELGFEEVRAYLVDLVDRGLSRGTCVIARNSLRHLYQDQQEQTHGLPRFHAWSLEDYSADWHHRSLAGPWCRRSPIKPRGLKRSPGGAEAEIRAPGELELIRS